MIDQLLEKNLLPDALIRLGIRRLLKARLDEEGQGTLEERQARFMALLSELRQSPIAVQTQAANEQHYEVPPRFFELCLGKRLKYSCALYTDPAMTLDAAEEAMLRETCARARLVDGQEILELGCGWGSLTLWMAEQYPRSKILGVSNSRFQREFILNRARERGLKNVEILTADMNVFETDRSFDRVMSVEMFEHMRNYEKLTGKISRWLKSDGLLFVHIFTHKEFAYLFKDQGPSDWMARYFFAGGIMPSDHLLAYFQDHIQLVDHWRVDGRHYSRTSEDWLKNMDCNKAEITQLFAQTYGPGVVTKWWVYWRVFFMSCAELWGYKKGEEWFVSHYLFKKS